MARKVRISRDGGVFIALVVISLVLLSVTNKGRSKSLVAAGGSMFSAVRTGISSGAGRFFDTLGSFKEMMSVKEDYAEALKRLEKYRGMERDILNLKNENANLRAGLGYDPRPSQYKYIAAEVIGKSPDNFVSTIALNRGSRNGVKEGMLVIAYSEKQAIFGVVGRISRVGSSSSDVVPVYDRRSYIASRMERNRYEGLTNGLGSSTTFAQTQYVSKTALPLISTGDLVITSGLRGKVRAGMPQGSWFPSGMYLGRVKSVRENEYESSLTLILSPIVNFSTLETVRIVTEAQASGSSLPGVASNAPVAITALEKGSE